MVRWLEAAVRAAGCEGMLADQPDHADAILLFSGHAGPDPLRFAALFHPLRRRHPGKTFLYHDGDFAVPILPGLYPSLLSRHHRPGWAEGAPYFARQAVNEAVTRAAGLDPERRWLASFIGAKNAPVRAAILEWTDDRVFLMDTTGRHAWLLPEQERRAYEAEYARVCAESRFILAPRGIGPSTYRQYEAWEIGRVPVILSDDWVPPPGIPWEEATVRVPECEAQHPERVLQSLEPLDDRSLGRRGRELHEAFLEPAGAARYLLSRIEALVHAGPSPLGTAAALRLVLQSPHRRVFAISLKRMILTRYSWRRAWGE
ncbi:MAG: exostosin family protein [Fimbriimonadaceae bacterium]